MSRVARIMSSSRMSVSVRPAIIAFTVDKVVCIRLAKPYVLINGSRFTWMHNDIQTRFLASIHLFGTSKMHMIVLYMCVCSYFLTIVTCCSHMNMDNTLPLLSKHIINTRSRQASPRLKILKIWQYLRSRMRTLTYIHVYVM